MSVFVFFLHSDTIIAWYPIHSCGTDIVYAGGSLDKVCANEMCIYMYLLITR